MDIWDTDLVYFDKWFLFGMEQTVLVPTYDCFMTLQRLNLGPPRDARHPRYGRSRVNGPWLDFEKKENAVGVAAR